MPALATSRPSPLTATFRTALVCPPSLAVQPGQRAPGLGFPEPHRPVHTAAGDQPSVAAQRHTTHATGVAVERCQWLAGLRPPEANGPVEATARDHLAIAAQRHAVD